MIDKNQLNLIPKVFIDAGLTGHNKEAFMILLGSGQMIHGFATTPTQFKAIVDMFNINLKMYENKYGILDMSKQEIPSPIQMEDLGNTK